MESFQLSNSLGNMIYSMVVNSSVLVLLASLFLIDSIHHSIASSHSIHVDNVYSTLLSGLECDCSLTKVCLIVHHRS